MAPLRDNSLFWHSVWISAGRPNGDLHTFMAQSRNQYHYAVRRAKRQADLMRAGELQEAGKLGDYHFLNEVKKTLAKKSSTQLIPECLEGEVTEDGIIDKFK